MAETAEKLRQKQPLFALALADAGIAIGRELLKKQSLRSASYLGDAWKERAIALAFIGKYRDAEEACNEAVAAYKSDPHATELDHAIVQLVRANFYVESDRLAEAEALATSAATTFRLFGDTDRYFSTLLLRGNILYMRRDYQGAVAVFEELIPIARRGNDLALVRALTNAAESHVALNHYALATNYFSEARSLWKKLGYQLEIVRANWSLANILLNTGQIENAIEALVDVRNDFDELGVVNDSALARLQLAEALIVANRSDEVAMVLDGVAVSFANEGLMRNANYALACLREAIESNNLEATLIRSVRLYLEELPFSPERTFAR
ncbi:MAG: tetratricopeptide repeat protein [Thermoanaerobaculia bacterium]